MQTPQSMFNPGQRTDVLLASLTAGLALILSGTSCSKKIPAVPIVFGDLAVPTSTNANFVCVAITNQSDSVVVYLACPLQVKSNGVWSGPPLPPRQRMTKLAAGQSGLIVVEAAAMNENARVPVLWGFSDYTPRATKWQQFKENFAARAAGREGVGLLYTNFLTDLKL